MLPLRRVAQLSAIGLAVAGGVWWQSRRAVDPGAVPLDPDAVPTGVLISERANGGPLAPPAPLGDDSGTVVVFMVDGLSHEDLAEALDDGTAPRLAALLDEHPSWFSEARASFPTSTAPNVAEALAGHYSDDLGGMPDSIHSLDRREGRLVRYEVERSAWDGQVMTLFDHVAGGGGTSWSYFEGYFPGASLNVHDELLYLVETVHASAREAAVLAYDDGEVEDFRRRWAAARRAPNLVFMRLGAVDTAGHFYGPEHAVYRKALAATDQHIGDVVELIARTPVEGGGTMAQHTTYVLFSDHGMATTSQHVDLDAALRAVGLSPWATSDAQSVVRSALVESELADNDVVAVPNGSNIASLYLRARGPVHALPWSKVPPAGVVRSAPRPDGPPVDLGALLLAIPEVARVSYRDVDGSVVALGRGGQLRAVRRVDLDGTEQFAALVQGEDPFGECVEGGPCCVEGQEPVDACFMDAEGWHRATGAWDHPSVPVMLHKALNGALQRRPDAMIEAARGAGFMRETKGDHGRYDRRLSRVPLVLLGAGVRTPDPAVELAPRLVDLMPTLAARLGIPVASLGVLDGEALPLWDVPADQAALRAASVEPAEP